MDAADQAAPAALAQQRDDAFIGGAAVAREGFVFGRRKNLRMLAERFAVFVDIGAERRDPGLRVDFGRLGVSRGDGAAERIGQRIVDVAGEVVERPRLVEALHLDRPFDRHRRNRRSQACRPASRVMATTPR